MIRKENGELVAECNECGEECAGGTLEWQEFIADLKDQDWTIRKIEEEWCHFCPCCSPDE